MMSVDKFAVVSFRITWLIVSAPVKLILILPQLYYLYVGNILSKKYPYKIYKIRNMVSELKKISLWHSNFTGLIEPWDEDIEFGNIFKKVSQITGNHVSRCFTLYRLLNNAINLDGCVAEVGVNKGRTAKVIALTAKDKKCFFFDTFEGMPDIDPKYDNYYEKGDFSETSLLSVKGLLSDCANAEIYAGIFPQSSAPIRDKLFCFVHVDVDIYRSVLDCCEFYYPRMISKGIMLFDDPGFKDCSGAKIAMDRFFSDKKELPVYLPTGQAFVMKL